MADWGRGGDSRDRSRVGTWDAAERRRRAFAWADALSDFGRAAAERLRNCAVADTGPGRLLPWLPVAFGLGIAIYFTADREPAWWARRRPRADLLRGRNRRAAPADRISRSRLACAAVAAGFAIATLKTVQIAHPVLRGRPATSRSRGFVEVREERERTDRIVVRALSLEGGRDCSRSRIACASRCKKGTAPPVGAYVTFRARLSPPLEPLRPGGYDFARDLYFQGIGASGFVLGAIKPAAAPSPPGAVAALRGFVEGIRDGIDARIRAVVPGDNGSIASALITGKRDAISTPVNDAMYISSLAHVLSISGYHMAVVAGVVFFVLRACLALIPGLASARPIKKWAAMRRSDRGLRSICCCRASEVATQRSFIMTAIVLVGVMADRPALTLRTLAVAALGVLLLAPQAVVHPSFQMSFAATLGADRRL